MWWEIAGGIFVGFLMCVAFAWGVEWVIQRYEIVRKS